jgi:bifunctional NMN adenylyltransferase/nudix hydrolase
MNATPETRFDLAVLIGRFQPFHKGHAALVARALEEARRLVVVLGSAHHARSAKNPFTAPERAEMIRATLDEATQARVAFVPVRDQYDDRRWAATVEEAVRAACKGGERRIALVGYEKDASSRYLARFPNWTFLPAAPVGDIDAARIRQLWYEGEHPAATRALLAGLVPEAVAHYLQGWSHLPQFPAMQEEYRAVEESRRVWGSGPFVTVDAVVRAGEHILLIRRGQPPGKGLWALPGGFLDMRETVLQGAIRELREETGLALLESTLEEHLKGVAVFDHPDRSQRGRTITHAHYFDLGPCRLPEVAGADDAADARWVQVADLAAMEEGFFEDHFHILRHFVSGATE